MLTKEQYLLIQAAEECAEVAHRVSKALRFGLNEVQEGQSLNNRARLEGEIIDLTAVLYFLGQMEIVNLNSEESQKLFEEKLDKIDRYMAYSREQGILEA